MKYVKEELEKLINEDDLSYREIGRLYGVSDTYIKKVCGKLNVKLPLRAKFPASFKPHNYGKKKDPITKEFKEKEFTPINCLYCGVECDYYSKKYCSAQCQQNYQSDLKYEKFLANIDIYCRENYNPVTFKPRFLKEQGNKCILCNMEPIWNGKSIVFILDHIDGNAANNKRENLRVVCPNCDSQLPTFKAKNKVSARKDRYFKQRNGDNIS